MSSEIRYEDVSLEIGDRPILRDLNLTIRPGESVALIGRSGAGKTTALRMINGLVYPSSGKVFVDGTATTRTDLVELRRRTGYIIQSVGLFPHRSVFENIATVPRLKKWDDDVIEERAAELLESVALPFDRYRNRFPHTLSGGEKQRVGIVRALIAEPDILLCDEPFGALDPIVRRELQQIVGSLRKRYNTTVVFVSHDLQEAMTIGDRIALFEEGAIVAVAAPAEFFSQRHPLVVQFAEAGLPGEGV
ncbi:MAG: ABC transporter ATP-binding protein [Thermoanaerobaculia bacterium]|nr:ABC transporter ATP-binding protein [Thermoanaerobaculia bacterium]